ncbi:hypothetical protein [Bradyrhizobium mercantei]|uniref:hypothetical protein n=1 Tax=Bradyrhizobium mercantei TaxID=1904807 RepID=UPI001178C41C|nr:hypothetical protein [Bradyrhizobium mercantei]
MTMVSDSETEFHKMKRASNDGLQEERDRNSCSLMLRAGAVLLAAKAEAKQIYIGATVPSNPTGKVERGKLKDLVTSWLKEPLG